MWICSKLGFYSIVKKQDGFHVRARLRRDLENLCLEVGFANALIEEWPDADYRWRIRLAPEAIGVLFVAFAESIDYSNFKTEIAGCPDQAQKLPIYGRIWQQMGALQSE